MPSEREIENHRLLKQINVLFKKHRGHYGSPRIYAALRSSGEVVNRKRIERLMREEGLVGTAARIYRRHALPENSCRNIPNLRRDEGVPDAINQQWAGDVTYLRVNGAWRYLAVIMDLYSRRIVGWAFDRTRTSALTLEALNKALATRSCEQAMLFHSDKDAEYGAHDYQRALRERGIKPSMNRPKTMTDNIHVESFFRTLKTESFHDLNFQDADDLKSKLKLYIENYYNKKRIHSSLGYRTPDEYEKMVA
ncbi:Uncharacterised protein [BD1-7 clade bacterium]|uniref:Integrase catalytic domain-containing protein n=1 Tax=BD1-7 clade bacterium TaxID=2029982 RepID=A0A5S9Q901_9GAMM|nr:Uncharacterised protein [BD1-7 clade bacterium]